MDLCRLPIPLHDSSTSLSATGRSNFMAIYLALIISIYIVGIVFGLIWIFTREYDRHGPPWVPSIFQTEACCVLLEPLVLIWPALLWPVFLIALLMYWTVEKAMRATTCCGREMRRHKRRYRWELENRRLSAFDNIELRSVTTESVLTPPPMYQSRVNSLSSILPPAKSSPRKSSRLSVSS